MQLVACTLNYNSGDNYYNCMHASMYINDLCCLMCAKKITSVYSYRANKEYE